MDETTFGCESKVVDYDNVPNDLYAYGGINIDDCLNVDELVDIMSDTFTKMNKWKFWTKLRIWRKVLNKILLISKTNLTISLKLRKKNALIAQNCLILMSLRWLKAKKMLSQQRS